MSRRVKLERDALWLGAADIAALLVGIGVHIVLTRTFDDGDYGRWVLLLDLFYLTSTIADLGLPTLIGRDGERLGSLTRKLVHHSLSIQVRVGIPLVVIGGLAGWLWVGENNAWLIASFILALSACVQICTYAHRAALRALGESRLEALVRFVDRGATALGVILAATMLEASPIPLALATFLGPAGALGIAILLGERRIRDAEPGDELPSASTDSKALVRMGLPFLAAAIALVANVRVEKLMLGILSTPEAVEHFQIAWLAFIAGYAPILSVRAVMLSWYGEVRHDGDRLAHRHVRARRVLGLCVIPGLLIGLTLGQASIRWVFPTFADEAVPLFQMMLAAWTFALMASPALTMIQVSDAPEAYPRALWTGIIADVLACVVLIPMMGIAGAAVSAGVGGLVTWLAAERSQRAIHSSLPSPSASIS